ncbi:MAG: acetamidase/formamidase family protein [Bryobacterales bacterium]
MLVRIAFVLSVASALVAQTDADHRLESTPETVVFGYYSAESAPVLRMRSGETVEITTSMIASPEMLEDAGLPAAQIKPALRAIHSHVTDRGPGPHILTGPVYVEGAMPGDTLEVEILAIDLAVPYALNLIAPGVGVLTDDYPYERVKVFPIDEESQTVRFSEDIAIPLRPFFGSMGVAPPKDLGRISSAPPWVHAGNLDNKELVAGTTLYIPVHEPGALFLVGMRTPRKATAKWT